MTAPDVVDVLVVGYGPVGATIACLLGRYGVRSLVIDKATEIFKAPRAIALDNEALRVLQMAGLTERSFDRIAIPFVRMRSPYVGELCRLETCGAIDGHPKLVTFYQPDLEHALRAEVARYPHVRTQLGGEVIDFVEDGDAVAVRVKAADGTTSTVRARYLIGADGASSRIRAAIGQELTGQTYAEDWLIVDARGVDAPIDHVEFVCDPKRPTPHMVAPGNRERWEFMLHPGEKREEMEQLETIRQLLAPWGDAAKLHIERKAVYRFHARCCDAFSKGRVFLAGDAAHVTPPFAGQGLVAGLRDAANLAWKLAAVTQGRATASILATYSQERQPHALAMIGLAKLAGRLIMPRSAASAILLHGLMRVARLVPPVRRWIDNLGLKPKNTFRRGLFVDAPGPLACGGQLPQAWVRDHRGALVLSDAIVDDQLTMIGFGVDPAAAIGDVGAAAWRAVGGAFRQLCHPGQALHRSADAYEDPQGLIVPARVPCGWVAVVRPDRVVLHQGPAARAARVASESLALLGHVRTAGAREEDHLPAAAERTRPMGAAPDRRRSAAL